MKLYFFFKSLIQEYLPTIIIIGLIEISTQKNTRGNIQLINNSDKDGDNTFPLSSKPQVKIKSPQYLNVLDTISSKKKEIWCFVSRNITQKNNEFR